jgi:hypothetical protein
MITIDSAPYTGQTIALNPVYNKLKFIVDSDYKDRYNFKYLFDVFVNGNKVARLKHSPDLSTGKGIAEVQRIVENYIGYDLNIDNSGVNVANNSAALYQVKCGEAYSREGNIINTYQTTTGGVNYVSFEFEQKHNLRVGDIVSSVSKINNANYFRVRRIIDGTKVETTRTWDAIFNGVKSFYIESENFEDNYFYPINGVGYVGFTIPNARPTRINVGDSVVVFQIGTPTNLGYNGEWKVTKIDTTTESGYAIIITNCPFLGSTPPEEGVIYSLNDYEFEELASSSVAMAFNAAFSHYDIYDYSDYTNSSREFLTKNKTLRVGENELHQINFYYNQVMQDNFLEIKRTDKNGTITTTNILLPKPDEIISA